MNQKRNRPFLDVIYALALRLARDPDFQVLKSVVVLHAVFVVNVLVRAQRATKVLFHQVSVFKDSALLAVYREPKDSVSLRVRGTNALSVSHPGLGAFLGAVFCSEVCRNAKRSVARRTRSVLGYPFSLGLATTSQRAKDSPVGVAGLAGKLASALLAVLDDLRFWATRPLRSFCSAGAGAVLCGVIALLLNVEGAAANQAGLFDGFAPQGVSPVVSYMGNIPKPVGHVNVSKSLKEN